VSEPNPEPPHPDPPLERLPIDGLKRVGPRVRERLGRLGIGSVQDLLFHLPVRYQDRSRVVPLAELAPGVEVQVEGQVSDAQISYGRRRSFKVWLTQEAGAADQAGGGGLLLRFFHFSPQQLAALRPGVRLRCYGEVRQGPNSLEIVHPE
jgi:ATP-dependent DNA helicase RecG